MAGTGVWLRGRMGTFYVRDGYGPDDPVRKVGPQTVWFENLPKGTHSHDSDIEELPDLASPSKEDLKKARDAEQQEKDALAARHDPTVGRNPPSRNAPAPPPPPPEPAGVDTETRRSPGSDEDQKGPTRGPMRTSEPAKEPKEPTGKDKAKG